MKKRFLLLATMFLMVSLMTKAQEYWIEGFYERHGDGKYTLKDVHTQGIYLDGMTNLSYTLYGTKENIICDGVPATMVEFRFDKATTDCLNKWKNGFYFQYWDEDNYKWKTDVEACKGESTGFSKKDMVMMLVLDYSFSMKDNIPRLQSSAINFINSISNVSNGNVHIGIIAFSGMDLAKNQIFPITPLDKSNKDRFVNFIRNSNKGKETALYFAMDKAMNMMEDYVNLKDFPEDNFNGTCMITFTDGLDNASINDDISVSMHRGKKNEYLAYISKQLKGSSRKYIKGIPVENFEIGFTGSEDFTQEDKDFFKDVLIQTTPDSEHFIFADKFEDVERYFADIAKKLTERWETINMYVGESQYGKVRWVLNCDEQPIVETPKPLPPVKAKSKTHFNINLGLTTMNVERTGHGQTDKYSLSLEKDATTKGLYLGVSWDMTFKYGLGIEFADLGFAYYSGSYKETYGYYTYTAKATSLNIYVSPVKFQYRYEMPSSFAVFAATGPALDYCVDYTIKEDIYDTHYGYGESYTTSDIYKSTWFYWDLKGGVAYKFMKLTLGTSLRITDVSKYDDYTASVGRPFYLMFSFVF